MNLYFFVLLSFASGFSLPKYQEPQWTKKGWNDIWDSDGMKNEFMGVLNFINPFKIGDDKRASVYNNRIRSM